MRHRLALLVWLLVPLSAGATIIGWVGVPLESASDVAVPDVVGEANFAAADSILEAAGLDGGTETVSCSAETADEILSQSPAAGVTVSLGTLVNLVSSSGTACGGRPAVEIDIEHRTGVEI